MNDRIKVRSASLNAWAGQAEEIAAAIRDALNALGSVDTSRPWWDSVGTIGPVSLKLAGQSVQLGTARGAIRGMGTALSLSAEATVRFAGQIRQAERNFSDAAVTVDGRIDALLSGTGAPGGTAVSGGGAGASWAKDVVEEPDVWDSIREFFGFFGDKSTWAVETIYMINQIIKGEVDWWGLAEYYVKAGSAIAKWAVDLFVNDEALRKIFGVTEMTGNFTDDFSSGFNPISIIVAALTTGMDNAQEVQSGAISADRGVVEWVNEFKYEIVKDAAIGAAGAAIAVALGATPVGWVAIAGTVIVGGAYCLVDWAYKANNVDEGRSITESIGHWAGERYDKTKQFIKDTGAAICDTVKSWFK